MERSLWRTALLEVRWRSDASKPVYLQMAPGIAEGIQAPRSHSATAADRPLVVGVPPEQEFGQSLDIILRGPRHTHSEAG
jgi:hypothetical protein